MPLSLDEQKLLELFTTMNRNIEQLARSSTGGAGKGAGDGRSGSDAIDQAAADKFERSIRAGTRNLSGANRAFKYLTKSTERLTGMTEEQLMTTSKGKRAIEAFNLALNQSSSYLSEAAVEYNKMVGKSIPEQHAAFRNLVKGTDGLSSQLAKAQRQSSLLGASLLKSHSEIQEGSLEYASYLKDLGNVANTLDRSFLQQAGLIDSKSKEIRDSLSAEDFSQLRLSLGEAQIAISEGVSSLGLNDISELIGDTKKLEAALSGADESITGGASAVRDALIATAVKLEKQGFDTGVKLLNDRGQIDAKAVAAFDTLDFTKLAAGIGALNKKIGTTANALDNEARARNTLSGNLTKNWSTLGGISDQLAKKLGALSQSAAIGASFGKALSSAKDAWKDIANFNIAQVPASYLDVQKASVKMGMSFEETTKFMQENKRVLAIYGSEGFGGLMGSAKETFARFGYNMQQAGELVGPAIEAGISSGVNIRSGESLNKFIDQTMESFKDISGIVNISAKEYIQLNAELLNHQGVQQAMVGMDQQRAEAYAKDLIAIRNNYKQMGLSTQQAQELVKAQQDQQRGGVREKVREAAKGMVMAQQLGMDPEEAKQYFQLATKKRSAKEDAAFAAIAGKMAVAQEKREQEAQDIGGTSAYQAQQFAGEVLMPTDTRVAQQAGRTVEIQNRAGNQFTSEQARAAGELAKGRESVAQFGNAVNTVSSVLDNNLTKTGLALGGAFLGLAAQSSWLMNTFAKLNATAGLGGALPGVGTPGGPAGKGGAAGKAGGLLGKAGGLIKGLGPGLGLAVGGMAADYAGDKLAASGHGTAGGLAKAAGSAATWAGTGAMLGLAAGPGGAAVGGALGGLAGGAYGLYQNKNSIFGPSAPPPDAPIKATPSFANKMMPTGVLDAASMLTPMGMMSKVATASAVSSPAPFIPIAVNQSGGLSAGDEVNKKVTANNKPDGIISVADAAAQNKLSSIAESLATAVKLLQQLSDQGVDLAALEKTRATEIGFTPIRNVPTAYQYVTGRS